MQEKTDYFSDAPAIPRYKCEECVFRSMSMENGTITLGCMWQNECKWYGREIPVPGQREFDI